MGLVGQQDICANDPLGQTHSPASSDNNSDRKFVMFYEILKSVEGRTDTTRENSDQWVGLVDQFRVENAYWSFAEEEERLESDCLTSLGTSVVLVSDSFASGAGVAVVFSVAMAISWNH